MTHTSSLVRVVVVAAAMPVLSVGATAARAQTGYPPAPASAPAPTPPAAAAPGDPAAAPPAPAPPTAQPGYYPPPGYAAPAPYAPPPGYYAQPGYAQPGYYPPPGYYPMRPAGPPPGYHEHDGFYMRLTMGLSVLNASYTNAGVDNSITGAGIGFGMAFGGSITPNLVLYGELVLSSAINPDIKNGETTRTENDLSVDLVGIGPGVAYYFMPANIYVSGTLAFSKLSESYNGPDSNSNDTADLTNFGIGATFMVGKEWWVASDWGLGVAGMVHVASMKLRNIDSRATAEAYSILFTATFN